MIFRAKLICAARRRAARRDRTLADIVPPSRRRRAAARDRTAEPDIAAMERVAALLRLPAAAVPEFGRELADIIALARGAAAIARRSPPARSDVMARIGAVLAALDDSEAGHLAAQFLGCPVPATLRARAKLADSAAGAKLFKKPGPRGGSRQRPELDFFLYLFLGLTRQYGADAKAYKNRETEKAAGGLVEILRLVAPCFAPGFLPKNDRTLLDAIDRARALHPINSKNAASAAGAVRARRR